MATFSWIETAAVMCAIVFGSAALASASWVWLTRRVFGSAGLCLSAAGVVLIGIAAWPAADQPLAGQGGGRAAAETLQPLEQKLGALQQGLARLEGSMQATPNSAGAQSAELKQVAERLDAVSARLAAAEALRGQVAELQEATKRQNATTAEALADLGEQTRARLIALQVSLDRASAAPRPAATPAAAPPPAAVSRPSPNGASAAATPAVATTPRTTAAATNASRTPAQQANATPARTAVVPAAVPRLTPVLIQPAAGPSSSGGGLESLLDIRPARADPNPATDGAEAPR